MFKIDFLQLDFIWVYNITNNEMKKKNVSIERPGEKDVAGRCKCSLP